MGLEHESTFQPEERHDREIEFQVHKRKNELARAKLELRPQEIIPDYSTDEALAKIIDNDQLLEMALQRGLVTDERIEQYLREHPSTQE